MSKSRKRKNLVESVTEKMGKRLHTSPKELEKHIPFYEVLFEDNERAYDFKEYFKLDDDEIKLFRSRKIPASVEKKRIKELQKQQELEEKQLQKKKELLLKNQSKNEIHIVEKESAVSSDKKSAEKGMSKTDDSKSKLSDSAKKTTPQKTSKKSKELNQDKSEDSVKETNDKKEPKTKKYKQTTLFDF
jgi:replication factor C large subunit